MLFFREPIKTVENLDHRHMDQDRATYLVTVLLAQYIDKGSDKIVLWDN